MCNKIKLGIKIYSLNNHNYEFSTEELPVSDNFVELNNKTKKFLYDFYRVFATGIKKK